MSFIHIPISTAAAFQPQQQTIPRQVSYPNLRETSSFNDYPTQNFVNNVTKIPLLISPQTRQVERNVPFKIYVFEGKFNHNLNSASNVLRFEIDSNHERSFELFDRVLREHSIDRRQFELHYVDDEDDLVSLTNLRDFQFMLKLMKGKLTKIICEKKSIKSPQQQAYPQQYPQQHIAFNRISQASPSACLFAQFQQPRVESQKKQAPQQQAEQSWENMIEKAFRSAFSNENPTQPKQSFFPQVAASTPQTKPKVRRIEISLSDLLGIPTSNEAAQQPEKEETKKEKKESTSTPQSFRELLLQRMKEMREEEQKSQQSQTQEKKQEEKPIQTSPTAIVVSQPKEEEEPIQEQVKEKEIVTENTPTMTTSLLLSNLIEDQPTESVVEQVQQETIASQEETESVNQQQAQQVSNQNLENQDPIIESIPEEEEEPVVKTTIPHKYQKELKLLNQMGFTNHILNITLLNRYEGDIQRAISDLIHQ
ncbi:predicted protein [Naegleria gruberi]|uniref:Predicted protein n=1 Tax=Naegleria gruberi TaxID=5762 RepID=D2VKH4_NAEGR|nr:uncharacterized protein NAEGRDRAFT_69394 [Naegleria gruberi]EFC42597.1 predicted protein [Naegleria gruberi]|eukprot:XP_002675341.1 predicted protein [Naegleria gruberi strain NEG-M]